MREKRIPVIVSAFFVVIVALIGMTMTMRDCSGPTVTPIPVATVSSRYIAPADPQVVPIFYRMFGKWGGAHDWQTLHPEWGPIGAIHWTKWRIVNPSYGVYNWSQIDTELAAEWALTVTLTSGEVISKPSVIQVMHYTSGNSGVGSWPAEFYDETPTWVYDNAWDWSGDIVGGRKVGHHMTRWDGDSGAVIPAYESATWRNAYHTMVDALADRYRDDPRVAAVIITTGIDGENQGTKGVWLTNPTYGWTSIPGGLEYRWGGPGQFLDQCFINYRAEFPNKAIFTNNAPGGNAREARADYAATFDPGIGLKHAGMQPDLESWTGYGSRIGSWDMIREYSMTLPIFLETPFCVNEDLVPGALGWNYWAGLAGMHYHPDAIDCHPDFFSFVPSEQLLWFSSHLGVTIADTPSVWTVLRDREYELVSWGSDGESGKMGDHTFWLTRKDRPDGETVRLWKEDMPAGARNSIYARQARRTNQATGDYYMYFDIDDDYPHVGQIPLANGGDTSFTVKVIYVDQGTDNLVIEYTDYGGDPVYQFVTKGGTDAWVTHVFSITHGYFNNNVGAGTSDFRISCAADGDEIIHLVEVVGFGEGSDPPATSTPIASLTPSLTPTITDTPANSPTATATEDPIETWTPAPSPTVTDVPDETATFTPSPPAATPTRVPGSIDITIYEGGDGGCEDTHILGYSPYENTNLHTKSFLSISEVSYPARALLRFDISDIPEGSTINYAFLKLKTNDYEPYNYSEWVGNYRADVEWEADQATWHIWRTGDSWTEPGGRAGTDFSSAHEDTELVTDTETWYSWCATNMVQDWMTGDINGGVVIKQYDGFFKWFRFHSSNATDPANRPRLEVNYSVPATPTATATITPTATGTVTPGIPTSTPTPTMTATITPAYYPTVTPTDYCADTPTPLPGALRSEISNDTTISSWHTDQNICYSPYLFLHRDGLLAALVYVDLSAIDQYSTVSNAVFEFYVDRRTKVVDLSIELYEINTDWTDYETTWDISKTGKVWLTKGCNHVPKDREGIAAASLTLNASDAWFGTDLTALIQEWVDSPDTNYGLVIKGVSSNSVMYYISSSEASNDLKVPRLYTVYSTPTP